MAEYGGQKPAKIVISNDDLAEAPASPPAPAPGAGPPPPPPTAPLPPLGGASLPPQAGRFVRDLSGATTVYADAPGAVMVDGTPVASQRLRSNDLVSVGMSGIVYQERAAGR